MLNFVAPGYIDDRWIVLDQNPSLKVRRLLHRLEQEEVVDDSAVVVL